MSENVLESTKAIVFTGFIKKQWTLENMAIEMSRFSSSENEKVIFDSIWHEKYSWYDDDRNLIEYNGLKGFVVLHEEIERDFFRELDFLLIEIEAVIISVQKADLEVFQRIRMPFNHDNPMPNKDIFESNICSGYRTFFSSSIFPMVCEFTREKWAINGVSGFSSKEGARNGAPKWITLEKTDEKGEKTIFEYSRVDNSKRKIPVSTLEQMDKAEKEFWESLKREINDIEMYRAGWHK